MSRFFHLEITPDPLEWIEWSKSVGVPGEVSDFIAEYPELLTKDRMVSMRLDLRPSPRSWFKLGKVLRNLDKENFEKYGYILAAGIVGPEAARTFVNKTKGIANIPQPSELLLELSESLQQRVKSFDITAVNALISRVTKYLTELTDLELKDYYEKIGIVSDNLLKLKNCLPKDSFFSIIRHIAYVLESEKGLKRAFYEKLLEELAVDGDILDYLEKRE